MAKTVEYSSGVASRRFGNAGINDGLVRFATAGVLFRVAADSVLLPAPAGAPSASPTAASAKKSRDEEQQYRADSGVHDCTDHTGT
jgi:hypothetical protein